MVEAKELDFLKLYSSTHMEYQKKNYKQSGDADVDDDGYDVDSDSDSDSDEVFFIPPFFLL